MTPSGIEPAIFLNRTGLIYFRISTACTGTAC